jgi:gliding motility-associated-like protein
LLIQQEFCTKPAGLTASNFTTTTADLSWTNPSGATSWQVQIQTAGSAIPVGSGALTTTTNTNFNVTGLTVATQYQYWVRADCGAGVFSSWAGPFLFNTQTCDATQKCIYTFRMTDSYGDGWNGNTMSILQNGVVVATIGATFTTGAGPIDVTVPLCETLPFELFWNSGGLYSNEIGVSVINNFTQTLYTKPPGTGSTGSLLYTTSFSCSTPACLPPSTLTATAITTTGANLGWNPLATTLWDVYVVTNGSAAPTTTTVPTNPAVTTNPFMVSGLLPNTAYQFYVRTVCSTTSTSVWVGPYSFTTLPTCSKPTTLLVNNVSPYTAALAWTQPVNPDGTTATSWQLFVTSCGSPAPNASSTAGIVVNTNTYTITNLTPVSCYDYYVRAICSTTDSGPWGGPKTFNTPDINDECLGSVLVPVNQNTHCTQTIFGTVAGATGSPEANSCGAVADNDDVWFHFVATATTHYISLLDPTTSTANPPAFPTTTPGGLNYSLYKGSSCSALTQVSCRTTNGTAETGLVIGETYRVRVYSPGTTVSAKRFEICIGTKVISCDNAFPLCAITPIIIRNDVGVPADPNPIDGTTNTTVGCLSFAPSPTYYFLTLQASGDYDFFIEQSTDPTFSITDLDVDFVTWGPFATTALACSSINVNNTRPAPNGCSYSFLPVETFKIRGGIVGETYIVMITNFTAISLPGQRGYIRITQTMGPTPSNCCPFSNFSYPGSSFCKNGVNPVPTLDTGASAGTYTSTAGLVINPTTGEINLAASTTGTYLVTSTIPALGGATGCFASINYWNVTISDPPSATISYNQNAFCKSETALQTVNQTGTSAGFYFATPSGLSLNATTGAIDPSTSQSGAYTVNYIISSVPGCSTVIATAAVEITPILSASLVSSDADFIICSNESATLTVTPTTFNASTATYVWSKDGAIITGANTNVYSPTQTGLYSVLVTYKACSLTLTQNFTVNTLPIYTVNGTNLLKCVNETATLTVVPSNFALTNPSFTYTWTLDGAPLADTTSSISVTAYGTYVVEVTNLGCKTSQQIIVTLDTANIPIDSKGNCLANNYIITASPLNNSFNPQNVTYQWSDDNGVITAATLNTLNVTSYIITNNVNPSSFPKTFKVKITTIPEGCTDTKVFTVENPLCEIPKGLSPNGDGLNDSFDLRGLGVKQLTIYNRYGGEVFSQADYTNEWHGQSTKSDALPVGTYYYVIDLNNGENKTGWVYINR